MIGNMHSIRGRRGFTLIELLVVIAIIAILIGMSAGAYFRMIGGQKEKNTKALLQKLHTTVSQQWSKTRYEAEQTQVPPSFKVMAGYNDALAKILWIKFQMRASFPMTYAEALNPVTGSTILSPNDLRPFAPYVAGLKGRNSANDPSTESAACLLLALQRPRGGMKFDVESQIGPAHIKDTDGDGVPELVDGWGKPITFIRWGTDFTEMDALARGRAAHNLDRDDQDVEMSLMDTRWNPSQPGAGEFGRLCHKINDGGAPRSYFTMPTIISAGRDGILGLNTFNMAITDQTKATDNIYSFKLK